MATIIDDFATNLTATLTAIADSKIYTDIEAMYDEGRLQKDQMDKVIIAFHEKALSMAGATAENIALKGFRLDEIITADLAVKYNEMNISAGQLAIAEAQSAKDLLVKEAQRLTEVERKSLIVRQKNGFGDNVAIERAKIITEAIGMIQGGGNDAPANFMTEWTNAIALLPARI